MAGREVPKRLNILIAGDAVAHTGFASVTHNLANHFSKQHNICVLGVNYFGDPHSYPYPIFPAGLGGDVYGIRRIQGIVQANDIDLVLIINDPWIVYDYLNTLSKIEKLKRTCYTPIDGLNPKPAFITGLNRCDHVFAYNNFGLEQMKQSGLTTSVSAIPHGVDTSIFYPIRKADARERLNLSEDLFIVGCCNRNQPRKRLDLAIKYFAEFAKDKPKNVRFYFHGALEDAGYDTVQLCQYYGIEDRYIITNPNITPAQGITQDLLRAVYSSWDVQITTTNGEGHGMTTHEGMACGVPQIVPDWAALGDWARGGVVYVPCTNTEVRTGGINTIGGIPDEAAFVDALNLLYNDATERKNQAKNAFSTATKPDFAWKNVASHFMDVFRTITK